MIAIDICIGVFFFVSAYFGVFGLRIIKDSFKALDVAISIISALIGFIILYDFYAK